MRRWVRAESAGPLPLCRMPPVVRNSWGRGPGASADAADTDRAAGLCRVDRAPGLGDLHLAGRDKTPGRSTGRLHQRAPAVVLPLVRSSRGIGGADRRTRPAPLEQLHDDSFQAPVRLPFAVRHSASVAPEARAGASISCPPRRHSRSPLGETPGAHGTSTPSPFVRARGARRPAGARPGCQMPPMRLRRPAGRPGPCRRSGPPR